MAKRRLLQSSWTPVGPYRVHARVSEDEQGSRRRAVVLVHGLGVSSRYMIPTAERLAPYCRVYAPDLPGFGRSCRPHQVLDVPQMADLLDGWMGALGLEQAAFVGNSMGCQAIVDLAARYPHRVTRAVLIGPTFDPTARNFFQPVGRLLLDIPFEPLSLFPVVLYDYLSAGVARDLRTYLYGLRHPIEEMLPCARVPTLVVRGEHDAIVSRRWAAEVARLLPFGEFVEIKGAAHAVNFSAPRKLLMVALPFLLEG